MIPKTIIIENFKRVKKAKIDLEKINVLVGGNNAGKSSILQCVHFSVIAQATSKRLKHDTFSVDNLPYLPCNDFTILRHGSRYGNKKNQDNSSKLTIECDEGSGTLKTYEIDIRRGRNDDNISCTAKGDPTIGQLVSNINNPFSVFVPGLAGVQIREELKSKAIILRGIASGDSNLYLRNVLHLAMKEGILSAINNEISKFFPGHEISISFDPETSENISAEVKIDSRALPIEIAGTGFLQLAQILSYINIFKPRILLLDEPDSHLHPDNQRILCDSLRLISETSSTTIIISTHSKHIIEGLYSDAQFIRMSDGEIKEMGTQLPRLPMLLEIGALDKYDKLREGMVELIVLTEDSDKSYIQNILKYNGIDSSKYILVTYKGCANIGAAIVLAEFMKDVASNASILVHRDRDFMTSNEVQITEDKIRHHGCIPFITKYSDIESYFCAPAHISKILQKSLQEVEAWIDQIAFDNHIILQQEFTRKRDELRSMYTENPHSRPSTTDLLGTVIPLPFENRKGKTFIKKINGKFHEKWAERPSRITDYSDELIIPQLAEIRDRLFPTSRAG